jgi:hypothetical protein
MLFLFEGSIFRSVLNEWVVKEVLVGCLFFVDIISSSKEERAGLEYLPSLIYLG